TQTRPRAGATLLPQRRCARCSNNVWQTRRLKATRNPRNPALLGAAYVAAGAHPPTALPALSRHGSMHSASIAARWAVPGGGDLWGGEHRSSALGARSARAFTSDSRRLSERNDRRE